MLALVRNRAQFLTANKNTQVRGRTPSYTLRFRRAPADPLYVVYIQAMNRALPPPSTRLHLQCSRLEDAAGKFGLKGKSKRTKYNSAKSTGEVAVNA